MLGVHGLAPEAKSSYPLRGRDAIRNLCTRYSAINANIPKAAIPTTKRLSVWSVWERLERLGQWGC